MNTKNNGYAHFSTVPKLMFVLGTRPEVIKLWSPIKEAQKRLNPTHVKVVLTGQHREMVSSFLKLFEIPVDYDLDIMQENQTLEQVTSRTLSALEPIFKEARPDWVIVQGDTTSAFAGVLAAFYNKIHSAHVEAGLRTYDLHAPYPEELNRQLISRIVDLHFCPTESNKKNLLKEGISSENISVTGNTAVDALEMIKKNFLPKIQFRDQFPKIDFNKKVILVTSHRRESFGEDLKNICHALQTLVLERDDIVVVYPVHLNPNVHEPVHQILGEVEEKTKRIILLKPLGYIEFLSLLSKSSLALTDSGGVQEEAPSFGVPVLVMREHTERTESIELGMAKLVGTSKDSIVKSVLQALDEKQERTSWKDNPYGDGNAGKRIVDVLCAS